ncbi:hypothetical protein KZP23_18895 [Echinicola marina]|uniref:hypothetical protein n=1 Tax=Echinicola marina TaxID=2859768 RepID=UPI001CF699F9|nr:hypothetical protein [Echinicola marina]UCS92727.1 hypothetical protein KZP23_18895 [Echinicola marina]
MKKTLFILLVLLYSCSNDNDLTGQYHLKGGKNISLDNGKCLKIDQTEYEICMVSVNDSRCPMNANCVWQGNAQVEFHFKSKTENIPFSLNTFSNLQQDTTINGLQITLLNVSPYPETSDGIDQADYSAEIILHKE